MRSVLWSPDWTRWLRVRFDPPLEPGRHTMWLELRAESGGRMHALRTTLVEVTWPASPCPVR